jgi:RNA polymerase sigma-70 factor (family 1)
LLANLSITERELLDLVASGDEKAFQKLFYLHYDHIYAVALLFTKSPLLSEEITQDVFLKVWQNRVRLVEVVKFDAYLFVIAKNQIYNTLRKKVSNRSFIEHLEQHFLQHSSAADESLMAKETDELINRVIKHLPDQQRRVYELSRLAGFDHSSIANQLNISKLTVKSHLTKALQTIKQQLRKFSYCFLLVSCFFHSSIILIVTV